MGLLACAAAPSRFEQAERARLGGEPIQAESFYRMVLEQEPGHLAARQQLAVLLAGEARSCWEKDDEDQRCLPRLQEALSLDPGSLPANLLDVERGRASDELAPQEAVQRLQQLVQEHPDSADVRMLLGACLFELGDVPASLEHFHQASRLAPAELGPQVRLAEALQLVNPEDARARMTRLLALHPDSVPVLLGLARVLARQGRFDEAGQQLDRARQVAPGNGEVLGASRRLERQRKEWSVGLGGDGAEERR